MIKRPTLPDSDLHIKVLVVDDHPNTANMLARAISQLGPNVEVVSATSGNEALNLVQGGPADILITDMIMPEMTGLELIEKLHTATTGNPPISFLMTAYDVAGLKVTARRLNVRDVFIKPLPPERICQVVAKAIEEVNRSNQPMEEPAKKPTFTILIADDKPDNQMLLGRYLNGEGYGYLFANDGRDALEKARSEMPDLILMDVNMPRMDGFAALRAIRSDPAIQHIPVIILTAARLGPADIQSGLEMGADDYMSKPFDRHELFARIRTKLRVKVAEDALRRRNRELNLLPEIGRELSARLNIEDLTTVLLKRTVETLGAMFGHIVILDSKETEQKKFHFDPYASFSKFVVPQKVINVIRDTRSGYIVNDTQKDAFWEAAPNDPTRSAIIVPMSGRRELLGVLVLTHEKNNYFTQDHLLLLQAITSQASIAVENSRLYAAMAQEQSKLAAIMQNAADAILMFNAEGSLSLVNPAGEKLFSDFETKIGQSLPSGKGYDTLLEFLDQARGADASFSGEVAWPDQRFFSASATPLEDGGLVVNLHDVTRFKELERVKDEFVATASHDLRNPITSIKGFNTLLKQAGPLNENQQEFVDRIEHATQNMEELVDNMLDLAKMGLESERKREILDITSLLWEMSNEFQPHAKAKKQMLVVGNTEASLKVQGDALKLAQALRNLIGNAIKYTPDGGTITLSMESGDGMVSIKVKDTGYGIPSDDLPHIFERFYRVRNNGHSEIEGNGLGLPIVKTVAEQHGGEVKVESGVGKGSTFTLVLPLFQLQEIARVEH